MTSRSVGTFTVPSIVFENVYSLRVWSDLQRKFKRVCIIDDKK